MPPARRDPITRRGRACLASALAALPFPAAAQAACRASFGGCPTVSLPEPDAIVLAGIGLVVALIWRGMAYYGYLLAGALVVPGWVAARVGERRKALG